MQKKLIALALAGLVSAPVFAQSNVTIYGILDVGFVGRDSETKDGVVKSSSDTTDVGAMSALSTSRLGFRGTEDLGNGLKANFVYELAIANSGALGDTNFPTANGDSQSAVNNTPDSFDTRLAQVGLSGNFGSVTLGRQTAVTETVWGIGNAGMSNNVEGALYTSGVKQEGTRYSSVVTYVTPDFSGLTAAVQYGKATRKDKASGLTTRDDEFNVAAFNVKYANGPLNVALAYSQQDGQELNTFAGLTNQDSFNEAKTWLLGANYDFKVVKVFGVYVDGKNELSKTRGFDDTSDIGGYELGIHVPVGSQLTLMASIYRGDFENSSTTEKSDADIDGFQVGALYALSKRTTAYAMYGDRNSDGKETTLATGVSTNDDFESQSIALGIRHSF